MNLTLKRVFEDFFQPCTTQKNKISLQKFSILSLLTDLIYLSPLLGKRDLQAEFNLEYNAVMSKLMSLAIRT